MTIGLPISRNCLIIFFLFDKYHKEIILKVNTNKNTNSIFIFDSFHKRIQSMIEPTRISSIYCRPPLVKRVSKIQIRADQERNSLNSRISLVSSQACVQNVVKQKSILDQNTHQRNSTAANLHFLSTHSKADSGTAPIGSNVKEHSFTSTSDFKFGSLNLHNLASFGKIKKIIPQITSVHVIYVNIL